MSAESLTVLPGWWGKLPGAGDFSHRRLDDLVRARLDGWLQTELRALRLRHAGWQTAYLGAPLWQFALGSGLLTAEGWLGVLMPSVDRVGRYFPLILAQPVQQILAEGRSAVSWWSCVTDAALIALQDDRDPEGLEAALVDCFGRKFERADSAGDGFSLPLAGDSHWRQSTGVTAPMICTGWPHGAHFDLMFDLAGLPVSIGPSE